GGGDARVHDAAHVARPSRAGRSHAMTRIHVVFAAMLLIAMASPTAAQTTAASAAQAFKDDVHASAGLACAACHQGAPAAFAPIARTAIAPLCAKCHSDAAYMKGFDPQV